MSETSGVPLLASLPMYHSNPARVEEFWHAIAGRLRALGIAPVPATLAWPQDFVAHWQAPDLLLSQACGYPLMTVLAGKVRLVGAFHYHAQGCEGPLCRSQLVVREDDPAASLGDLRGRRVAYNGTDSQSGYNSLRALVAPLAHDGRFFGGHLETGAHHLSVMAVRDGQADIASIDCVSLAGFKKYAPEITRGIRILGQSAPYPGLPLITAAGSSDATLAALRSALDWAAREQCLAHIRQDLFIAGFEPLDFPAWRPCADMRDRALGLGCPTL